MCSRIMSYVESEEKSRVELSTMDNEAPHEKSAMDDEIPQIDELAGNQGDLTTGGNPWATVCKKSCGVDVSAPLAVNFEEAEKSGFTDFETEKLRTMADDASHQWRKLNLAIPAFGKLLFEQDNVLCSAEDNGIETDPETSKGATVNDVSSKKSFETSRLHMIGTSLGSAVGAAFSEMLLKMSNSRSPVPPEKMSMILEGALKELSILVEDDDGCSRLVTDFITAFKNTYATMYRIQQACTSYEVSREINLNAQRDDGFPEATCKKQCTSAKSNDEIIHTSKADLSDHGWQVKPGVPLESSGNKACTSYEVSREINFYARREDNFSKATCEKQCTSAKSNDEIIYKSGADLSDDGWQDKQGVPLESSSNKGKNKNLDLLVDAVSEENISFVTSADCWEFDSGAVAASSVEIHNSVSAVGSSTLENLELNAGNQESLAFTGNDDDFELTSHNSSKSMDKGVTDSDYEVDDASSFCNEPCGVMPSLDSLALMVQHQSAGGSEFQKDFLKIYERYVRSQEQHNHIKLVKLAHSLRQQSLEKEKIQLSIVANGLMRENIDLDRSKANFKESRVLQQEAKDAYVSFSTMCADELAAGLLVMLATLVYSVRKYSIVLLNDLVSTCQSSKKEPRRSWGGIHVNWFYNSLDSLVEKLQAFVCRVSVTGRISFGLALVAVVASSMLRRSVTSSSQAMPATILIIVLGGVCGFIGKISVDSLGGSGNQWWVVWGAFCVLHAFTNCFTPSVCRLLHGPPTSIRFGLPFWIRRLAFHSMLVLVLPVLAGLLPFGSFCLVMNDFFSTLAGIVSCSFSPFYKWPA